MSSVIDVHTRNGNGQQMRRTISLAPFVNMGVLEGPIKKGKFSYLFSGRASTVERVASAYIDQPLPYTFGDFFGKLHAVINESHRVSASAIHTYDRGTLERNQENADEIRWKNTAYGVRYLVAPPSLPILGEVLFSISRLDMERGPSDDPVRTSGIEGFNLTVNVTNFGQRTKVDWGFYLRGPRLKAQLGGLFQNLDFTNDRVASTGGYLETGNHLYGVTAWPRRSSSRISGRPGTILRTPHAGDLGARLASGECCRRLVPPGDCRP